MIFYERLATLLTDNKITRKKFSSDLQIGINQLKRWEDSGKLPKRAMIVAIADYFGVTTAYLLGETEAESKPSFCDAEKADPSEEELLRLWRRIPPEKRTMVLNIILAALKED